MPLFFVVESFVNRPGKTIRSEIKTATVLRSVCLKSLKGQNRAQDAATVQKEFQQAWKNADTKLTVADLWNV